MAGTLLALALGGWWWVSHPPETGSARPPGGEVLPLPADRLRADVIIPEPAAGTWMLEPGPEDDSWQAVPKPRPTFSTPTRSRR